MQIIIVPQKVKQQTSIYCVSNEIHNNIHIVVLLHSVFLEGIISLGRCPQEIISSRGDNLHYPPTSQTITVYYPPTRQAITVLYAEHVIGLTSVKIVGQD